MVGILFALLGVADRLHEELPMKTNSDLLTLIAKDIMSKTVLTVPRAMSLAGAARLLSRAGVSGAPVVDELGRCAGVISATDLVGWVNQGGGPADRSPSKCDFVSSWQMVESANLPDDRVDQYMTSDPVTVGLTAGIGTIACMMRDARIHRVIVVDDQSRPIGIVSSTDILAALARFAEQGAPCLNGS